MHRVAESIDHIEDRIGMRDRLPDRGEHRDRVEHSSKIGQWCEDEVGNYGCRIKAISHESVQESDQSKEERSEECEEERESDMSKCNMREEHRHTEYDRPGHHATDDASRDESEDDHPIWSR